VGTTAAGDTAHVGQSVGTLVMAKRQVPPRDRRGRFTKRQTPPLDPALVQRVGAQVIRIGDILIELPRVALPRYTNDDGRWRIVDRKD
jgi:hypothetical protein